mmetsp:Transcript_24173/g.35143  ORF Transcript_24173/g.35143 Transcript_24173/m.35143 type:complete len:110 (-) Transcript_24173:223-552(-)
MGRSDDPIVLRGTAMNDDDFIGRVAPENVEFTLHVMYTARILLACIFCEYKTAVEIAEKSRKTVAKALPGSYMMTIHFFMMHSQHVRFFENLVPIVESTKRLSRLPLRR